MRHAYIKLEIIGICYLLHYHIQIEYGKSMERFIVTFFCSTSGNIPESSLLVTKVLLFCVCVCRVGVAFMYMYVYVMRGSHFFLNKW